MAVNYFAGFNPDMLDPNKALVSSLYQGAQLQGVQAEAAAQQQKALQLQQARELETKRQQLAQELFDNPTAKSYSQFMVLFPEQAEAMQKSYSTLSDAEQKDQTNLALRLQFTTDNNNVELTKNNVDTYLEALKNGKGDPQSIHIFSTVSEGLASGDPEQQQQAMRMAKGLSGLFLKTANKDIVGNITALGKDSREQELQPAMVDKATADADKARVEADNAQEVITTDLENKKAATDKTRADIDNAAQITDATVRNTDSQINDREFQQQKKTFVTGGDGKNYIFGADGTLSEALDSQGQQIGAVKKLSDAANLKMVELMATNDAADIAKGKLQKALQLNKTAYKGAGAEFLATVRNNIMGGSQESQDTLEYQNLVTGQALESLKATFGAAPTEGERAMLLKLQASVNYPREVRARILGEALSTIDKKKASNERQMKTVIGSAKPYSQGGDASTGNTGSAVPAGRTMSMADARIAASRAGMTVPQAIAKLKAQGITVVQ